MEDSQNDADILAFPAAPPSSDETVVDPPLLRDVIGDVLREERTEQGRTLADVAEEAAVSLPYLSEIERGRKEVSSDVLDAVIRSLDLELDVLLERAVDRLRTTAPASPVPAPPTTLPPATLPPTAAPRSTARPTMQLLAA